MYLPEDIGYAVGGGAAIGALGVIGLALRALARQGEPPVGRSRERALALAVGGVGAAAAIAIGLFVVGAGLDASRDQSSARSADVRARRAMRPE